MKASIVVLSYNQLDLTTKPCIESLYEHTDVRDFELIVVDNDSKDATPDYLKKVVHTYPNMKIVLNSRNKGFAAGNNDGIKIAKGKIIILLNSDTLLSDGWLNNIINVFNKDEKIGLVGPVSNSVGNEQQITIPGLTENNYQEAIGKYLQRYQNQHYYSSRLGFFCVAIKKSVVEKIGLLDEVFGRGMFEDDDYCIRARNAGYRLAVAEDSFVYHKGSVSFSRLSNKEYLKLFEDNKKILEEKHSIIYSNEQFVIAYLKKILADLSPFHFFPETISLRLVGFKLVLKYTFEKSGFNSFIKKFFLKDNNRQLASPEQVKKSINDYLNREYDEIVIYPPTIDWHLPLFQRPQHLARSLARSNVLFFYGSSNIYDHVAGYEEIEKNVVLYTNFNEVISSIKKGWILFQAGHPGFSLSDMKYWKSLGYKIMYEYLDELDDKLIKNPDSLRMIRERHQNVSSDVVDLVVVTAKNLHREMLKKFADDEVLLLPNGVDCAHFSNQPSEVPSDLKPIANESKPIIGYYGAMASWLDYELIDYAAKQRPDYQFIFIGWDFDGTCKNKISKESNVFYLGLKPYQELPSYGHYFNAAIIPFIEGNIAKSTSPLKLFEYMALGKPVVCTKDLLECSGYSHVYLAKNKKDFVLLLDKAVNESEQKKVKNKLIKQAEQNSWISRAAELKAILQKIDKNNKKVNFVANISDIEKLNALKNENEFLVAKLYSLQNDLNKIQSAKAFKAWQKAITFKKKITNLVRQAKIKLEKNNTSQPFTSKKYKGDILYFGVIGWDSRYQRPQHIASSLSESGYRIFYIENGFFTHTLDDVENSAFVPYFKKQKENIFSVILSASHNVSIYNETPTNEDVRIIQSSLLKLSSAFDIKKPIAYVTHPFWVDICKEMNIPVIYDCMDDHAGFENTNTVIDEKETKLFQLADKVIVSSKYLYEKARKIVSEKKIHLIRNGCDYLHFSQNKLDKPSDIATIKRPIVGYYGAIAEWFDADLMIETAKKFPNVSLVLIGAVTHESLKEKVKDFDNIYLLGEKPYSVLPQYVQFFDVCTIPFLITNLIKATNPVKLYEYMATGKPIVTTPIPEVSSHQDIVYWAKNKSEYLKNIRQALLEKDSTIKQKRIDEARKNTWSKVGAKVEEVVLSLKS